MGNSPFVNGKDHPRLKKFIWDNTYVQTLAEKIISLMEEQGFNYKSLSLAAGLGETAVRDIAVGRVRSPKFSTLEKLAKALKCSIPYLLGDSVEKNNTYNTPSISDQSDGILRLLQIIFAILTMRKLVSEDDLASVINQQLLGFQAQNQLGAIEVMEAMLRSLGLKPHESDIQAIRKLLKPAPAQSRSGKA